MSGFDVKPVEDCFDGSSIYEYSVKGTIGKELILFLGSLGALDYFPEFPRPFFRVRIDNGSEIKGVFGETRFRITYSRGSKEEFKVFFEKLYADEIWNSKINTGE